MINKKENKMLRVRDNEIISLPKELKDNINMALDRFLSEDIRYKDLRDVKKLFISNTDIIGTNLNLDKYIDIIFLMPNLEELTLSGFSLQFKDILAYNVSILNLYNCEIFYEDFNNINIIKNDDIIDNFSLRKLLIYRTKFNIEKLVKFRNLDTLVVPRIDIDNNYIDLIRFNSINHSAKVDIIE